ncbi:peptide chain release factor N(5)-glutamine methyltransferase [bacterium]|nr:peptide chain release factor N(5)-glutamine methyltransferase [bacterium]
MTQQELEEELIKNLQQIGVEVPRLEAKWMFEKVGLRQDGQSVSLNQQEEIWSFFDRRSKGEPLAYILEERGFYKDVFFVNEGVLIPRPETEILVDEALGWAAKNPRDSVKIFDFGCGTGCIGLSILKELMNSSLVAFDLSPVAVEVAKKNSENLKLSDRSEMVLKSVDEIQPEDFGQADIIVSNPPYIADNDPNVWKSVHQFEPKMALYSGPSGFEKIEPWSKTAFGLLRPGGFFTMEFGKGQDQEVIKILQQLSFREIRVIKDLAGLNRVVTAQKEN